MIKSIFWFRWWRWKKKTMVNHLIALNRLYWQFRWTVAGREICHSSTVGCVHAIMVKGEQWTNWMPRSRRRLCRILFTIVSIIKIRAGMSQLLGNGIGKWVHTMPWCSKHWIHLAIARLNTENGYTPLWHSHKERVWFGEDSANDGSNR